jgi:cell division protein YceG involved in septum cleavage
MGLNPEEGPYFVAVYINDVLIFSRTLKEHLEYLRKITKTL